MDELQQRRIAANEARYRDMNEHVTDAVVDLHEGADPAWFSIMCECAIMECSDAITIPVDAYVQARSNPRRFVVRPDHVFPTVEETVERHDEYWIVEKFGAGAREAEQRA